MRRWNKGVCVGVRGCVGVRWCVSVWVCMWGMGGVCVFGCVSGVWV